MALRSRRRELNNINELGGRVGGAGGIRTLDTALQPYNGLANRRLQPLGHSTIRTSAALLAEGLCWLPLRAGSLSATNQIPGRGRAPFCPRSQPGSRRLIAG